MCCTSSERSSIWLYYPALRYSYAYQNGIEDGSRLFVACLYAICDATTVKRTRVLKGVFDRSLKLQNLVFWSIVVIALRFKLACMCSKVKDSRLLKFRL